jgi:hypothetical protein
MKHPNQYHPVHLMIHTIQEVNLDYTANIAQNQTVLTTSQMIYNIASAKRSKLPSGHPDRVAWGEVINMALEIQKAEAEEDDRHKDIIARLRECFPPLLNILKAVAVIGCDVGELLVKLNGLAREVEAA